MGRIYYEEAGITIYHGDCRDILGSLTGDLILTDPPYGMSYRSNHRAVKFGPLHDDFEWNGLLHGTWIKQAVRALPENGVVCLFTSDHHIGEFRKCLDINGLNVKRCLVWQKNNWTAGDLEADWGHQTEFILHAHKGRRRLTGSREPNVLHGFDRIDGGDLLHPTEKPESLMRYLITKFDARSIIDPFMGSGTSLVAAKRLGRSAAGVEIEERYCEIAAQRLSQGVLPF